MFRPRKRKPSEKKQRSPEFYARQATRTVRSRTFWLMLVMGILLFVILFFQLYHLQITRHQEMQTRALAQQPRQTVVSAFRGTIYDRNGSQLAVSVSTETVFLSPKDLKEQLDAEEERLAEIRQKNASLAEGETPLSEESQVHWTYDSLAASLSEILGVSQDTIRSCMDRTDSQYEVLAKKVDEDVADQIRQLINDTDVHGVYMVADAKRVYPYGSLASHVLGFVGTDNTGLYGLESRYDKYLQGQTGLVVTAKDERGNPLPYEYEQYFAAENGQDLVLTLDANVQYYLEKYVGEMADKYGAEYGATGIVMDVKTGGILGMVSYPTYDVNDAFTVQNDLFKKNLTDTSDQLLKQWRNKALNDTYEPGSTFKILTMSAAMEEGLINMNTTYTCTGGIHVSDATIHCTGTHGTQTLKEAAAHSCNPAFITFGLQLGNEKFYEYMNDFGLMNGTGSDTFSPNASTTRGMLMTVLARYAGEDTTGGNPWYQKGMEWAKANGVSDGTNPEVNITREQLVTMLYRYAGSPKANGSLDSFSDAASVSSYAVNAMQWAVANGIVNGSNGKLNPKNNAIRAEVAAILMRFCEISK